MGEMIYAIQRTNIQPLHYYPCKQDKTLNISTTSIWEYRAYCNNK